jgi:hypothetical protein
VSQPRRLFIITIPVLWATICTASFQYPGDEYGLWAIGALPGLWVPLLVHEGSPLSGLWLILAGGIPVMAGMGAILDRLRAPWLAAYAFWVIVAGCVCAAAIGSFPSWTMAIAKNGSFQAYALSSLNLGLAFAGVGLIVVTGLYRAVQAALPGANVAKRRRTILTANPCENVGLRR